MMETGRQERSVAAWLAARSSGADEGDVTALLVIGLRALWDRARPSLGEVTLGAIFRRAIRTAERRHRELEQLGLRVTDRGWFDLTSTSAPRVDLRDAVTGVIAEVLRALSRLTADGLTQPLHAALASVTSEEPRAFVLLRAPLARCDSRDERGLP